MVAGAEVLVEGGASLVGGRSGVDGAVPEVVVDSESATLTGAPRSVAPQEHKRNSATTALTRRRVPRLLRADAIRIMRNPPSVTAALSEQRDT